MAKQPKYNPLAMSSKVMADKYGKAMQSYEKRKERDTTNKLFKEAKERFNNTLKRLS